MSIIVDTNGDGTFDKKLDSYQSYLGISLSDWNAILGTVTDMTSDGHPDVDLRTQNSSANINGATFGGGIINSGTGNFNDFLGIQNTGTEHGFNENYSNGTADGSNDQVKTSTNFTHAIHLSDIAITTINGVQYYDFRLDANEDNSNPTNQQISLDTFQIRLSQNGAIHHFSDLQAITPSYDMDSGNNVSVLFTDAYSSGSGRSDLSVLIPISALPIPAGHTAADTYLYLYSEFGYAGTDYHTDATFEEWRTENAVTLHGIKFNDHNGDGIDNGTDLTDHTGTSGITINLYQDTFVDTNGNGVQDKGEVPNGILDGSDILLQTTTTDANGNYNFYGVKEGQTYFVQEVVPAGWTRTTGDYEKITVSGSLAAGTILTVDPIGNHLPAPGITVVKSATVPGDCADTVGELVTYTVTAHNTGQLALTNVVLTDSFEGASAVTLTVTGDSNTNGVLDPGEVWLSGDTGNDHILGIGETWTYSYVHAVTQADIDSNGDPNGGTGDGTLDNTATVDADSINGHVSDTSSTQVDVCQNPDLTIVKSASVPGDCADTVGELVTYTVTLHNTGNVTLTNVVLTDSFEGGSDATLTVTGDTNANGVLDAGEVWLSGDTGNDGKMGVGETWTYTYAHAVTQGDIDSNGGDNDGTLDNTATVNAKVITSGDAVGPLSDDAAVDVCQNPALTIDKSASVPGDCADTVNELVTYTVAVHNTGNVTLDHVVLTDSFEGGSATTLTVTGDTNANGVLDAGEVWLSGDTGNDGKMGVGETWTYTYAHAVTQSDIDSNGGDNDGTLDNTATVNAKVVTSGDAVGPLSDDAAVDVCQNPALTIDKSASVPGDCADTVGELVTYTVAVANTGNVAVDHVVLTDSFEGGSATTLTVTGDTNANGVLDAGEVWLSGDTGNDNIMGAGETWTYTYAHAVTQSDIDTNGGDNDGTLDNTATVNALVASSGDAVGPLSDSAAVDVCPNPDVDVTKYVQVDNGSGYGAWEDANSVTGPQTSFNTDVNFQVLVENTGNVTLTGITLTDLLHDYTSNTDTQFVYSTINAMVDLNNDGTPDVTWASLDANNDGKLDSLTLAPGDSFTVYYSLPFAAGQHTNTVTVTDDQSVTDFDPANYYGIVEDCVGVRTPGFWASKQWASFWDGVDGNEPKQAGTPGFADGELLQVVDSNHNGSIDAGDQVGLLIGDYSGDGITNNGEDTLFISLHDAKQLINASQKTIGNDGIQILGRDVVATWLNYLAGNGIGDANSDPNSPQHFINDAVDWFQQFASDANNDTGNSQATFEFDPAVKTSTPGWQVPYNGAGGHDPIDHSASAIHSALDSYNNTGTINGVWYTCDADDPAAMFAMQHVA